MVKIIEIFSNSTIQSEETDLVKTYLGAQFPESIFYYHLAYVEKAKSLSLVYFRMVNEDFILPKISLEQKVNELGVNWKIDQLERVAYILSTHDLEDFNYKSFIIPSDSLKGITHITNGYLLWKHQMQQLIMKIKGCNSDEAMLWVRDYNKKTPEVKASLNKLTIDNQTLASIIKKYHPNKKDTGNLFFYEAPFEQAKLILGEEKNKIYKPVIQGQNFILEENYLLRSENSDLKKRIEELEAQLNNINRDEK